jgi:3-oxoacyl-[acyl-carrier-protein] synthase II
LQRRVVVTGIGLICAVGNTAPEAFKNLLAGKSGMGPITQFDATG